MVSQIYSLSNLVLFFVKFILFDQSNINLTYIILSYKLPEYKKKCKSQKGMSSIDIYFFGLFYIWKILIIILFVMKHYLFIYFKLNQIQKKVLGLMVNSYFVKW